MVSYCRRSSSGYHGKYYLDCGSLHLLHVFDGTYSRIFHQHAVGSAQRLQLVALFHLWDHETEHDQGTLGSLVAFGINFNASNLQVPMSVYIVFVLLMASAFFIAAFSIVPPAQVRRRDGTPLAHYPHEGLWEELKRQRLLLKDWRLLAMFIPMFASEVPIIVLSSLNCEWTAAFPCATLL